MFLGILTFLSVSFGHHSGEDFPVHSRTFSFSTSACHNKLEHITQVLKTLRRPLLLQHQVPALPGRPGPSSGHQRATSMHPTVQLKTGDSPNFLTPTGLRPLSSNHSSREWLFPPTNILHLPTLPIFQKPLEAPPHQRGTSIHSCLTSALL